MSDRLRELARMSGVILEYYDIWGHLHHASDATLRTLLASMGVAAADDVEVERSIAAAALERWRERLPPVAVLRQGRQPWSIRFVSAAARAHARMRWSLREEGSAVHTAEFTPAELPLLESAQIGNTAFDARALTIASDLPCGYHHLRVNDESGALAETLICVAPARCYWPPALQDHKRVWGVAVQLYAVRSERNWGIGDFSDLTALLELWGLRGAAVVGLNPLHALYPDNPAHASPYSPSSRLFKNWIYLDPQACPDFAECDSARDLFASASFQARLHQLRASEFVDYVGVAAAKREIVEQLYAHFRDRHLTAASDRCAAFRRFQAEGGAALRSHAVFEALQSHLSRGSGNLWGWPAWPQSYRDPDSDDVRRFCDAHTDRIEFFEYLQWQVDEQFGAAARRSVALGMGLGVYEDLAVSIDRGGAEAWANQAIYGLGCSVGCPPDDFNLQGQDWGLPPMIPGRLRAARYAPYIATLRANMRHAGALRIDHVMGLMRLFWVPAERKATDGTYVNYPFEDLLGLLALESERNRCLVIGEDLGTVPDEVRHGLGDASVLSYRLLYFERGHDGEFRPPHQYAPQTIVAATTHDLPTLAGWWEGRDITLRTRLALYPTETLRESQTAGRIADRPRLLRALEREGLLPPGIGTDPAALPHMTADLHLGAQSYLAKSPAKVLMVQLEDVLGAADQVNLPGTTVQYPNWCRKLPGSIERMRTDATVDRLVVALARLRT